ncbi:hypothetical protein D3C75_872580 [compost metagenome]
MNVDLDQVIVSHHQERVAHFAQLLPESLFVKHIPRYLAGHQSDDELGAIAEFDVLGAQHGLGAVFAFPGWRLCSRQLVRRGGRRSLDRKRSNRFAPERRKEALINAHETLASGIHNPNLLQHGELLRSPRQSQVAGLDNLAHQLRHIGESAGYGYGMFGRFSGNGKNGALHRLDHRLVGCVHSVLKCCGKLLGVGALQLLDRFGEAAEQLGQNNAGVAPRTHQ